MISVEKRHDEGELLVIAMTRPAMIGGLTLASLVMSLYLPVMAAFITRSIWAVLLIPVLLITSYLVCLKDVYLFDIIWASSHLRTCPNKRIWRCRRYAPR